jgi:hypothetical protein
MNLMNTKLSLINRSGAALGIATALLSVSTAWCASGDWQEKAIAPAANPIYFEDPRIYSELNAVFMQHYLPNTFHFDGGSVPLGGEVRVFAAQLRLKLTERLALIATKDGYIEFRPNHTLSHQYGWADLAAGLKYALVDDREKQWIVTPGFTLTIPTGNERVFQGRGAGEWNLFVSAEKGWNDFHLLGNAGFRIPNNFDEQTAQAHYSLQADYYVCKYFIPFVVANGYTILTDGNHKLLGAVDLNAEMYDLINFGSTKAAGSTQITIGGGARSKLMKNVDVGAAYEAGMTSPKGIFDSRVTADVSLHW